MGRGKDTGLRATRVRVSGHGFAAELRARLSALGDPAVAAQQQRYMKSAMPYFGVKSTPMRAVFREVFDAYAPASAAEWKRDVLAQWRGAEHREERYAALALCGHRSARAFQ